MIYAVDFDGTLSLQGYPKCGKPNQPLFEFLRMQQRNGHRVILYTCREGLELQQAINWCAEQGLMFHAVNSNIPEIVRRFRGNPRKIYADFYIDDRAVNPFSANVVVAPIGYLNEIARDE